jgi:hypothetical protein
LRQCGTIFDKVDIETQETDAPVSIKAVTCLLTDLKKTSTVESLKKLTSRVLVCEIAFSEGMTLSRVVVGASWSSRECFDE